MSRYITKEEWQNILSIMEQYNHEDGYVARINNRLMFFDSAPHNEGKGGCYVTRDSVKLYIEIA